MRTFHYLLLTLIFSISIWSCQKEQFITDGSAMLTLKTDTLTFDTVFTTIGSTTLPIKIYNGHDQKIKVDQIQLAGGEDSQFKINIGGAPVLEGNDYEIAAGDSMYLFAEVTVDPNDDDNPYIIKDSILLNTNGNLQKIMLIAYGQNANYFNAQIIGDTVWTPNRPFLIYNSVLVDSGQTLTIQEGCQLHFHKGSKLYVRGTLIVNGSTENQVVFKHDRLESLYDDGPGQWGGIHLLKGANQCYINNAIIENSEVGIQVDSLPVVGTGNVQYNSRPGIYDSFMVIPNVLMENSIIRNISGIGILGLTAVIEARNCLVYNCGANNVNMFFGGIYDFDFCTFINMQTNPSLDHKFPVVKMSNYYAPSGSATQVAGILDVNFTNSIIYGNLEDEIEIDSIAFDGADFKYMFRNTMMKYSEQDFDKTKLRDIIVNTDPLFAAYPDDNYELHDSSVCVDAGSRDVGIQIMDSGLEIDLLGNNRIAGPLVDMGAYEKQQ